MGKQNGFKKYPSIDRIGHDENNGILDGGHLVVQEKLDGANFRFTWDADEERVVFGSRNVEYWNEKDIDSAFMHAVEYVREHADTNVLDELTSDSSSIVVFGEAMHAHTLDYGEPEQSGDAQTWVDVPNFIGFDVWTLDDGFLDWAVASDIIDEIGLETVPIVYDGPAEDWDAFPAEDEEFPESEFRDGIPEGIVVSNETTGQTAKHRTQRFKEKHGTQSVADPDEYEPSGGVLLARQFTTEARVLKMIHKYKDRGETIEMGIMEDLWRDVFDDIIEEEYETIFLGNYTIDTKEFRSEVASITADVLQRYLSRPDGSVLNESE
jgi:hypothetical protein